MGTTDTPNAVGRLPRLLALASVGALLIGGCGSAGSAGDAPTPGPAGSSATVPASGSPSDAARPSASASPGASVMLPPTTGGFDYQLGGGYPLPAGVTVVSRDRADSPAPGAYSICYVNGFQTQPEEERFWLTEHPDLVLTDAAGKPVVDRDWGELLLDTRTETNRAGIAAVVGKWIEGCARAGFDALEIDNLDSYARSGGRLSQDDNVALMGAFSAIAHANGLASAQKNSTELLGRAATMRTDFAIAEECNQYHECAEYTAAYGNRVYVIEYRDRAFAAGCRDFPGLLIVRRDLQLTRPGHRDHVDRRC